MVAFFSYGCGKEKLGYDLGFGKVGLKDQAYLLDSLVSIELAKNADPVF